MKSQINFNLKLIINYKIKVSYNIRFLPVRMRRIRLPSYATGKCVTLNYRSHATTYKKRRRSGARSAYYLTIAHT